MIAHGIVQPTRKRMRATPYVSLFGLATGGVYHATARYRAARCALTAPFHPDQTHILCFGGLFSVALSLKSPSPDVIWHPALCSPDFPHA